MSEQRRTTTGILFQGVGNGIFTAYDTDSGETLWEYDAYGGFSSSVMTYMVNDEQYVATMVSGSLKYPTPGTLLVFKLNGKAVRLKPTERSYQYPAQPVLIASAEQLATGNSLYHEHCAICHRGLGQAFIVATATPDLRMMSAETRNSFDRIVLGGLKKQLGMPAFDGVLDETQTHAIRDFVISQATRAREAQLGREAERLKQEREAESRGLPDKS